ncbi:hypothetical protein E6O75_ATG11347 [Venturia nashicola]|uniref:Uncharacterized protein n=1 Tax=Venturia nashicola TaxID=86259 RepID=A0A4Z1P026_9PEZI|nr:hypothetical protein E6O75_ATG11347 [Venturia nashicola]
MATVSATKAATSEAVEAAEVCRYREEPRAVYDLDEDSDEDYDRSRRFNPDHIAYFDPNLCTHDAVEERNSKCFYRMFAPFIEALQNACSYTSSRTLNEAKFFPLCAIILGSCGLSFRKQLARKSPKTQRPRPKVFFVDSMNTGRLRGTSGAPYTITTSKHRAQPQTDTTDIGWLKDAAASI